MDDTSIGGRKRGSVYIVLADPDADFRKQDVAATCMAAAKFYAKARGFKTVSVFFSDVPGERPWQGRQMARCHHAPDGKGFYEDAWEWHDVWAAPAPLADEVRQTKRLWGELADKGTGAAAIRKAVAAKLGIPADKVTTPPFLAGLGQVDERPFTDVKPQGPAK